MEKNYHNCIYILVNSLYPGYVKIGYATNLNKRLSSLNTGMLRNFEVYAVYETPTNLADKQFHNVIDMLCPMLRAKSFDGQKIQDKEFFKLEPQQVYELLSNIAWMTATIENLHKMEKFKEPEEKLERITYEQIIESLQKEKRNDTGIL